MVGANFNYQFIDWAHDEITPEDFDHAGTLSATVFTPNITMLPINVLIIEISTHHNISGTKAYPLIRTANWQRRVTSKCSLAP